MSEHTEQVALMDRAAWATGQWPELALLFAIPNGGARTVQTGARLKAEGVRAGVPDLCLPVARGGYHGLFIELKAAGGALRPAQAAWLRGLEAQGYRALVATGWEAAWTAIEAYLTGGTP